ncbi:MAG TPA: hypothetical protein VK196_01005 [Magnetospirillum sp.]|nr:hypothetical protein [Magnetospirillum sp.]
MAKKTTAKAAPTKTTDSSVVKVPAKEGQSPERQMAELALSPTLGNAYTARAFMRGTLGDIDMTESILVMRGKAKKVQSGDLSEVDATLTAQAVALDAIFTELARRAALNMGQHLEATEKYIRLALKAQAQCRATLQTLAEIKNPQPVAFVKQANIAHGPQQVNNGISGPGRAPAREKILDNQSNRLLECEPYGEWLDTGTAGTASGTDPQLETVGALHRPDH